MNTTFLAPEDLLKELVAIASVSREEENAAHFLVEQMKAAGFREAYVDSAGSPVGHWGPEKAPQILLVGHIDTVPGEVPLKTEVTPEGTRFFGRGSVDAKGPLATFVSAVAKLPKDLPCEIVVVGAVEEEVASSKGARQVLRDFQEPKTVIIGEPSGTNGITLGYKGRLVVDFTAKRSMSHSASADKSAGDLAFLFSQEAQVYAAEKNKDLEGIFKPLDVTIQSLRTDSDGLSETCKMCLGFRLGPSFNPDALFETLQGFLEKLKKNHAEAQFSLDASMSEYTAQFDKRSEVARVLRQAVRQEGLEPRLVLKTGTSDMNVLSREWSCPMVAYGPGDSDLDHTPNEHIILEEYSSAVKILSKALQRLSEKLAS